jgi:hypothetical protein
MTKFLSVEELAGRMDCFGDFDAADEICLRHCGLNFACAGSFQEDEGSDWIEEGFFELPDANLD